MNLKNIMTSLGGLTFSKYVCFFFNFRHVLICKPIHLHTY
jgi:hypothetical protein